MEKDLTLLVPSYNKAPYIERCVKSISEQTYLDRTKIIVIDDESTDNSIEVLKQAANKYRVPMTLFLNEHNLGINENIEKLYQSIDTNYYAFMSLDDYYIHPERLERGVNFLKSHPDYSIHGCNFYWEIPGKNRRAEVPENIPTLSFHKYCGMPFFQGCVPVFRNFWNDEKDPARRKKLLDQRRKVAGNETFAHFCAIHYGKCYYEKFLGTVYYMADGIWASTSEIERMLYHLPYNRDMAAFAMDFFNDTESARHFLNEYVKSYFSAIDYLHAMMNDFSAENFQIKPSIVTKLQLPSNDIPTAVKYLLDQIGFLKQIGAVRKLGN